MVGKSNEWKMWVVNGTVRSILRHDFANIAYKL